MTWPGESIRLDSAYDVGAASWSLWDDVVFRADSRTLASGGHWKLYVDTYFFTDHIYLTGSDSGDVSWVVEVLSGSGTVTAAEGTDPGFGDSGFTAGTALGSHALTAGTNVIPSTFTAADIYDMTQTFPGVPMLDLQATAGSVVVQQVKLRVWPVGGPVGSLVTKPGFTLPESKANVYAQEFDDTGGAATGDVTSSWDAAVADLIASAVFPSSPTNMLYVGQPDSPTFGGVSDPSMFGQQVVTEIVPEQEITTGLAATSALLVLVGVDPANYSPIAPTLVEGVDWWRHPNEVYGDVAYYATQIGTGSTGWSDTDLTLSVAPYGGGAVWTPLLAVSYSDDLTFTNTDPLPSPVFDDVTVSPDYAGTPFSDGQTVTLTPGGSQFIILTISHSSLTTTEDYPGGGATIGGGPEYGYTADGVLEAIRTYPILPPYQVWSADYVPPYPMRIMQRGDVLGMGSGRVFGVGTRQGSNRVLGSY